MLKNTVKIENMTGLDVAAAGAFCDEAMKYKCHIEFIYGNDSHANAKSMLSCLGAAVPYGAQIELVCDGEDEEEAMTSLLNLFNRNFLK